MGARWSGTHKLVMVIGVGVGMGVGVEAGVKEVCLGGVLLGAG